MRKIYDENKGRYGYRRITKELRKAHKLKHKTMQRLMREIGIFCHVRKKYKSFRITKLIKLKLDSMSPVDFSLKVA